MEISTKKKKERRREKRREGSCGGGGLLSRTGNDRDRDGHYVSQKERDTESEVRENAEIKKKEGKQVETRGWEGLGGGREKASQAKIPVSFQFSILLGRFACVIPRHVSSTSRAVKDCGWDGRGRRWKDRCSERWGGDRRG